MEDRSYPKIDEMLRELDDIDDSEGDNFDYR